MDAKQAILGVAIGRVTIYRTQSSLSENMFATLLLILVSAVLPAPPAKTAIGKPVALFNGQNLSEWTYHLEKPDVKPETVWSIKDGVLRCTGQPVGYLVTKRDNFENFKLSLEWRWPGKGGNNGALVHVTSPGALGVWPKCFEVQLQSGTAGELWVIGTTLQITQPNTHIEDRRHKNLITGAEKPLGKWNKMEIVCLGNQIWVNVNGYLVNYATNLSQQRGAIALQSEGTPIEYRNITLSPVAKQALSAPIRRAPARPPAVKNK
jgi:hypothetical protein